MRKQVKVIILGAGSAGLSALSEVQRQTDDFLLVNQGPYGTSCARVACMPTKTLCEITQSFHLRHVLREMGVQGTENLQMDIPSALSYVKELRDSFVKGTVARTEQLREKSISAKAKFIEPNVMQVGDDIIEAESVVIATGSSPVVPGIWEQFGSMVLTTDQFFELDNLPEKMAVIGLGPSGMEYAQSLSRMGVNVTAFDIGDTLAGLTDHKVIASIKDIFNAEFPVITSTEVHPAHRGDDLILHYNDEKLHVQKVLLAMGRRPNLEGLGLEDLDIEMDPNDIPVFNTNNMKINNLPIYIAGDVNGYRPLLHEAADEGRITGYNAVRSGAYCFQRRTALAITYTDPHIARVGESFRELQDKKNIIFGECDFASQSRARMTGKNKGLLRIYLESDFGYLKGAELIAPDGEHLAHLLSWAIQQKNTVFDLLQLPFYHPAVEEGLRTALRDGMDKLSCKKEELELLLCNSSPEISLC
jgi:dihydrolipoamide dehydrogenase